jgi:hypothetical protein
MSDWLSHRKYQALLLALLLLLVAYPALRGPADSPVLARTLLTLMFLAGSWVVFADSRMRAAALVLGVPTVAGAWLGYALPEIRGRSGALFVHAAAAGFQVLVLGVLLAKVYREPTVTLDVVAAALCGYLLLGVAFGHVDCIVHGLNADSFRGLEPGLSEARLHLALTYFSFVTLTTVGFGDITAASDTARSVVIVEAVAGQFYLAVLVADLVGKRLSRPPSPPNPSP